MRGSRTRAVTFPKTHSGARGSRARAAAPRRTAWWSSSPRQRRIQHRRHPSTTLDSPLVTVGVAQSQGRPFGGDGRPRVRSAEFHREVADTIIHVWRQRQRSYGYDVDPEPEPYTQPGDGRRVTVEEPGILSWAPSADGPQPAFSTVAEMTEGIGRVYDALRPTGRSYNVASSAPTATGDAAPDVTDTVPSDGAVAVSSDGVSRTERSALWVVAVGDLGGVARHVLDAVRAGIPGWRVIVLCPEGPLAERLRAQGTAVLTVPISPADSLVCGLSAVRHAVRTLRPTIVHSHLAYSDFLVAGAAVSMPPSMTPKFVTTEHGIAGNDLVYHGTRWRSRVMEFAHAARLRRFDALIAVAEATLQAVRDKWHPPRTLRTVVIPNGVDPIANVPVIPPGRFHVVSLSRLAPEKGLDDLLEAFALVHSACPSAHATLAGEGPLRAELSRRVADPGLQKVVPMPGYVDADSLLRQDDILTQLSTWENCSYTLLDGLAAALSEAIPSCVSENAASQLKAYCCPPTQLRTSLRISLHSSRRQHARTRQVRSSPYRIPPITNMPYVHHTLATPGGRLPSHSSESVQPGQRPKPHK